MLKNAQILDKRYRINEIIGRGGLSTVYKAEDLEANCAVRAVKEISKQCTEIITSAKQESQLIKELYEHDKYNFFPNIIQQIETDEALYIVMDYINGYSMNTLLHSGALSYNQIIEYGKDICSVIQFLHDYGKIYSDMKPDNIMILDNSGFSSGLGVSRRRTGTLKLVDFGAVVQMESGVPVQYTPEYAAPEQFRAMHLDQRTDVFNIGATLYHMTTGKKPLPVCDRNNKIIRSSVRFAFDPKDRRTDVYMQRIIKKCVEDSPEKRFRSCRELYHALEHAEKHSHIKITLISASLALLCGITCVFSHIRYIEQENIDYAHLITTAEKSASYSDRIDAYKSAIALRKDKTEAYFGLIETYKEDVSFDESESYDLVRFMTSNESILKQNDDYELLAFETGKLYWYYYDYGLEYSSENTATRMKASAEWFSDAAGEKLKAVSEEKYQMAKLYYDIGIFHSEIQKLVIEGNDTDIYEKYWKSINEMTEFIDTSKTETEIVLLETYKLIINSISAYAYKFSSFVSEQDIRNIYYKVRKNTEAIITTTEKTESIRQKIRENYLSAEDSIERAYGGSR